MQQVPSPPECCMSLQGQSKIARQFTGGIMFVKKIIVPRKGT